MNERQIWRPSILDEACRGMVISSSWVYKARLDKDRMEEALGQLLSIYPILGGRLCSGNAVFPDGGILLEYTEKKGSAEDIIGRNKIPEKYEAEFGLKRMLKGRFPLLSVKVTVLCDGSVLSVKASHLVMDGRCFYNITDTLMTLYSGGNPESAMVFDDSLVPKIKLPASPDTQLFYPIPKTAILSVIWKKLHRNKKKRIFIRNEEIMKIKDRTGATRTAILSAMVYDIMGRKALSIVHTADHRSHVKEIPSGYGGNAASTLPPIFLAENLSVEEASEIIDKGIRKELDDDEKYLPEYLYLLKNRLPYLPFPLGAAWKNNPECIICNSFISFGIYREMAADGIVPSFAFPPDLPDPVRFFPAPPEEHGIYILLNL